MISIIGLTFAFLLLASVLGYLVISTKMNPILKVIIIIITAWYSIALYAAPGQIAGHPKMVDELPDGAWILSVKIMEPRTDDPGGMYFWLYEDQVIKEKMSIPNPYVAFVELHRIAPRAYGIPYDKRLHKQYEKAKRLKTGKGGKGGVMMYKRGKRGQTGNDGKTDENERGAFKIINPVDLLPSKD